MARVSVLIPTYNNGRYLKDAVESVLAQTYTDYEIIVVDDGSADDTAQVVKAYPSVRYIAKEHSGISPTRNRAVREASGEYITYLDSDDLWVKDKLEKQVAFMDGHPECLICFYSYSNFTDIREKDLTEAQKELIGIVTRHYMAASIVRKKAFDIYGYFDEELSYAEDTEWSGRIMIHNKDAVSVLDEKVYLRRIHSSNITLTHEDMNGGKMLPVIARSLRNLRKAGLL